MKISKSMHLPLFGALVVVTAALTIWTAKRDTDKILSATPAPVAGNADPAVKWQGNTNPASGQASGFAAATASGGGAQGGAVVKAPAPPAAAGGAGQAQTAQPAPPPETALTTQLYTEYVPPSGEKTVAKVSVDGQELTLLPDQNGDFKKVMIKPKAVVAVQLNFPEGEAGDAVMIEEEDGGLLDDKDRGKALKLDDTKNVNFTFSANADQGIYHVMVRKGGDMRMLNFWAGAELPLASVK